MRSFAYVNADPGIPIPGSKGSSIHVASVCREFVRRGMTGAVYAARPKAKNLEGIPILPLPTLRQAADDHGAARETRLLLGGLLSGNTINGQCDLVYERYSLWHIGGMARAQDLGVPFILEVNSPLPDEARCYRGLEHFELAVGIARLLLRKADGVVCVSKKVAEWAGGLRGTTRGVWVVPNGVDPELFSPDGSTNPLPWREKDLDVIAFAGSFRPWHGVDDLLDAFRIVVERGASRARLLCIGDGPLREDFERQARATGVGDLVHVTGMVTQPEVARWLRAADVAVAPYPVLEGFYFSPLKIYEFMATGVPVVAADVGQVSEVVPDGLRGRLYPPGNRAALAETLLQVLNRREHARRMARAGRAWILKHATWARRVDSILGEVAAIESRGPSPTRRRR